MLGVDASSLSAATQQRLDVCSQTIEGICYLFADVTGATKNLPNFRCLQLTTQIDAALYAREYKRQSKEMKERILTALDLPLDNWEEWAGVA